jgi:DNA helicase-2/ATP-dependent DNA helicase PcrA
VGQGDCQALAAAVVVFLCEVGKGLSPSAFGNRFEKEVSEGCAGSCRGKPATIQHLARILVAEPNHYGVAKVLRRLSELIATDENFAEIEIDCRKEFREATRYTPARSPHSQCHQWDHSRTQQTNIFSKRS